MSEQRQIPFEKWKLTQKMGALGLFTERHTTLKKKFKLGTVIPQRELEFSIGRKKQKIIVTIGKPKPAKEETMDWYCPFQIQGIGLEGIKGTFGMEWNRFDPSPSVCDGKDRLYRTTSFSKTKSWKDFLD
ncbi:hypothetical protein [Leptospira stimsonii]|uniref:hypothetical protein n=1 Tax=Leptospira stimsonii TaxID=2202203 RepID=UPI001F4EFC4D|nr:hypothetical protein [Leptospira stimsonii]